MKAIKQKEGGYKLALVQISMEAARVNAHLTVDEAAEKLGVTRQTLRKWETGNTCPRIDYVRKMAEVYEIPLDNIFLGDD